MWYLIQWRARIIHPRVAFEKMTDGQNGRLSTGKYMQSCQILHHSKCVFISAGSATQLRLYNYVYVYIRYFLLTSRRHGIYWNIYPNDTDSLTWVQRTEYPSNPCRESTRSLKLAQQNRWWRLKSHNLEWFVCHIEGFFPEQKLWKVLETFLYDRWPLHAFAHLRFPLTCAE